MAISPIWWDCVANQSQGYMPRWCWVNTLMYHSHLTLVAVGKEQSRTRGAWVPKRKWRAAWPIILESEPYKTTVYWQNHCEFSSSWWLPLALTAQSPSWKLCSPLPSFNSTKSNQHCMVQGLFLSSVFITVSSGPTQGWLITLLENFTHSVKDWPAPCPARSPHPQCHKCPWKAGDLSVHAPRSLQKECEETVGKCVQQKG